MKLTIKNILVYCAGLLSVVAFFLMFANGLKWEALGNVSYTSGTNALFGYKEGLVQYKGAAGAFVGYLLVLIGGLCPVVVSFVVKDAKVAKLVTLVAAGLLVVGAVLVFCEKAMFFSANGWDSNDNVTLAAGPVVAGIFALVSACGLAVSQLVKLDK